MCGIDYIRTKSTKDMIVECLTVLGERDVHNLMRLLNELLSGGCIHNEWKENIVVLVRGVESGVRRGGAPPPPPYEKWDGEPMFCNPPNTCIKNI